LRVEFAHFRVNVHGESYIKCAVFFSKANPNDDIFRDALLVRCTIAAELAQPDTRRFDAAALAYEENGQMVFWGHEFLMKYLKKNPLPKPNGWVEVYQNQPS